MPEVPISVRRPRPDQSDLRRHAEHASALPDLLHAIGLDADQQGIIRHESGAFALYTLTNVETEPSADIVRMGLGGRGRLDAEDQQRFRARLDSVAVDPAATVDEALRGDKLLELFDDGDGQGLIILAPHGGDIEPHTDDQAEHVQSLLYDLGVSCWRCKGWKPDGGAAARWHITSTDISTASFPRLATAAVREFTHAVSFHGFTEEGRPDVLVGGAAPDPLKRVMQAVIAFAVAGTGLRVELAGLDDPLGGDEEANLVNRLTKDRRNGIQIEQQPSARTGTLPGSNTPRWQAVATAVADVYRLLLTAPPVRG
jgi:phage replication-related protein YjqB (UPF0714/DUF867 family)